MFRRLALVAAAFGLLFPVLTGTGTELRAQGNCPNCDLPPGCRGNGNGNQNGNGNGNQNRNCQRLTITIESDIDFGRMVLLGNGAGRVLMDLGTGQRTLIGDIDDLGGMPITGSAIITGAPFETVIVSLPGEIEMRDAGKAVLLVSVELDEIRSLSDRIIVMFDGHIVGERPPETGENELGLLMAGVSEEAAA